MIWKKGDVVFFTEDVSIPGFFNVTILAGEPCAVVKCNLSHISVVPLSLLEVTFDNFTPRMLSGNLFETYTLRNKNTKRKILRYKKNNELAKVLFSHDKR